MIENDVSELDAAVAAWRRANATAARGRVSYSIRETEGVRIDAIGQGFVRIDVESGWTARCEGAVKIIEPRPVLADITCENAVVAPPGGRNAMEIAGDAVPSALVRGRMTEAKRLVERALEKRAPAWLRPVFPENAAIAVVWERLTQTSLKNKRFIAADIETMARIVVGKPRSEDFEIISFAPFISNGREKFRHPKATVAQLDKLIKRAGLNENAVARIAETMLRRGMSEDDVLAELLSNDASAHEKIEIIAALRKIIDEQAKTTGDEHRSQTQRNQGKKPCPQSKPS